MPRPRSASSSFSARKPMQRLAAEKTLPAAGAHRHGRRPSRPGRARSSARWCRPTSTGRSSTSTAPSGWRPGTGPSAAREPPPSRREVDRPPAPPAPRRQDVPLREASAHGLRDARRGGRRDGTRADFGDPGPHGRAAAHALLRPHDRGRARQGLRPLRSPRRGRDPARRQRAGPRLRDARRLRDSRGRV